MAKKSNEQKYAELLPSIIGETIRRMRKYREYSVPAMCVLLQKRGFSAFSELRSDEEEDSFLRETEDGNVSLSFGQFIEVCNALKFSVDGALAFAESVRFFDELLVKLVQNFSVEGYSRKKAREASVRLANSLQRSFKGLKKIQEELTKDLKAKNLE